jgi:competence protein ComFB
MAADASKSNKGEVELVNITEEFVKQSVKQLQIDLGACQCDVCFYDACAIALNELPPKYVTTSKGALLTEITTTTVANHADIVVEATKAVMKVMKKPRH